MAVLNNIIYRFRLPLIILFNVGITVAGYMLALALRFDFNFTVAYNAHYIYTPLCILLAARLVAYFFLDLFRGYWRYVSTHDLVKIFQAHLISSFIFTSAVMFLRVPGFPRSVIFIEFMISILAAGGTRLLVRLFCERFLTGSRTKSGSPSREVIILGAGDSGNLVVKNLRTHSKFGYDPVAILDDSARLHGSSVQGVPVFGSLQDLRTCIKKYPSVSAVIVAIPSLSPTRFEEIKSFCDAESILLKRVQAFEDIALFDRTALADRITIESLLEKESDIEHEDEIKEAVSGKVVLITGAGGSIGSELVRQVVQFSPSKVILLDHSEYNLFQIDREITEKFPYVRKEPVIATVCDKQRLSAIMEHFKPELVFHAAAYKHVPLMELNGYEAFKNNVLGTKNVLDVSDQCRVKRLVLVSTDKAVDPSSVMGCSKRIAELLLQEYARSSPDGVSVAAVRFGNVINSAGSVIPLFKDQILSGGPITVTHPEMERFFMSIREAVRLVLTAGTLGERGEIYVLDMGKPVKIVEVAQKMLALYARKDIRIVFTGIRPGEKLTERLSNNSEVPEETRFRKVSRVSSVVESGGGVAEWVLLQSLRSGPRSDYSAMMKGFVLEQATGMESYAEVASEAR